MSIKTELIDRLEKHTAHIGVVGMGYVGLPIALRYANVGFKTTGFDIDADKIDCLMKGGSYIKHIPSSQIASAIKTKSFKVTADFSVMSKVDVIIIAVPTPLSDKKEPDLTYVIETAKTIAKYLRKGHAVSLESTTYPGTTREELLTRFENEGLKVGRDFFLIYSPEREDPGNPKFNISDIPKVVGGITPDCLDVGKSIYGHIVPTVVPVKSTEVAEMSKLLENIFRSVNIALVNELKMLMDKMGIDIWEVIAASSTKPFGFMPFQPGPGLGGHCIPIDPFYLSWKAKEFDFSTRFIELAGEINTSIPYWVINKVAELLNMKSKCLKGAEIFILGVAYKKGVDDMRESPALQIIKLLKDAGAKVRYHDQFVPRLKKMRQFDLPLKSTPLTVQNLARADAVLIITDHDEVDYAMVVKHSDLVIDTRNATGKVKGKKRNVFHA